MPLKSLIIAITASASLALAQPPDTLWTRTYGGNYHDEFHSVIVTPDGGYLLAGQTYSYGVLDSSDGWIVKTDSLGTVQWSHILGGPYYDVIYAAGNALDGGYIVPVALYRAGRFTDLWLCKLDALGDTVWTRWFGGEWTDWPRAVRVLPSGEILVAGSTSSFGGSYQMWLLKCSANGDSLWSHAYGGPYWEDCWAFDLTNDGGFVLAGYTSSYGAGAYDMWLLKVNADGDSLWSRTFGGPGFEEARSIAVATDGGFLLAGYNSSVSEQYDDAWIVKTDSLGDYQWDRAFGGGLQLRFEAIFSTADSGYLAAGWFSPTVTHSDVWLVRGNVTGDTLWSRRWTRTLICDGNDMARLSNGGYVIAGQVDDPNNFWGGDGWLLRGSLETTPASEPPPPLPDEISLSIFPNPFNSTTTLTFTIPAAVHELNLDVHNLLGQSVMTRQLFVSPGIFTYSLDAHDLPSGLYFLSAHAGQFHEIQKLMLLR